MEYCYKACISHQFVCTGAARIAGKQTEDAACDGEKFFFWAYFTESHSLSQQTIPWFCRVAINDKVWGFIMFLPDALYHHSSVE